MSIEDQATLAGPATERRQPRRRVPRLRIMATVALWSSLWWLIIGALVAPLVAGGWWTVLGAAAISVAPLLVILEQFAGGYPSALVRVLVFRPFLYVQLATPFVALAAAAGTLAGALVGRGVLVGRWALAAAAATFTVTALVGYIGSRQLRLKHLEARFPDLPPDLDGLRIVQVSDVHVGPHTPARHLRRIVAAVEQSRPDVIALTGDHVDDYAHDVTLFAQAFGTLRAPLGVFAVPGNHDIYAGWAHVRDGLETMGAVVLVNRAVERRRGSASLWIAGTGDPAAAAPPAYREAAGAPDIERTLAAVPAGAFTLVLAHNPALWPALAARGASLTLSGHTHYGQVALPRLGWSLASIFLEHAMGAHRRGPALLYINPGTNFWGLPVRIGALHEVTVVTLRRGDQREPEIVPASSRD